MDYNLEFVSHILKNTESLLLVLGKSFNLKLIDFTANGFSPARATCVCIQEFYKQYNTLITLSQVETFVTQLCAKQEQAYEILKYFKQAFDYTPTLNFQFLLDTIKKEYGLYCIRNTLLSCTTTLDDQDLESTVAKIQQGLSVVSSLEDKEVVEGDLASSLDEFYEKYKKIQNREMSIGITTGFPTFDKNTGGLKAGELDIITAGSNEGKSVLMLNIGHHVHTVLNKNVIYFSIELPKDQIIRRYLSRAANINIDRFRDGILTQDENDRLLSTMEAFKQRKNMFYIVDSPSCTVDSIAAKYEELSLKTNIDLIIIDYLGIMKPKRASGAKWEDLGNIALDVRHLARKYKLPILTAMQVKQDAIKNTKNPVYGMTDMANSFMVVHHADTVLSLKLKDPVAAMQGLSFVEMTANTAKVRDGQKCQFDISAQFANMRMEEPQGVTF